MIFIVFEVNEVFYNKKIFDKVEKNIKQSDKIIETFENSTVKYSGQKEKTQIEDSI